MQTNVLKTFLFNSELSLVVQIVIKYAVNILVFVIFLFFYLRFIKILFKMIVDFTFSKSHSAKIT